MTLRNRILNFENWVSSNFKLDAPKEYQKELLKLFHENKDAFLFYRNWLFTLLLSSDEREQLNEFRSIFEFKAGTCNHTYLINHFLENNSSEIFSRKRLNTFEISLQLRNTELEHTTCFLYQQYYETDVLFLSLYSFLFLNVNDLIEIDLKKFRDIKGRLKKGLLIESIKHKLKIYPLTYELFRTAYDSKIRNLIGHNNYKIDRDKLTSIENENIVLTKDNLFKAIGSMQNLNNYLLNYFSNKSISIENLKNAGILGVSFDIEAELPVLSIFQLSCFYDLGGFQYLDKVQFNINQNQLETIFGYHVPILGEFSKELERGWFKPLLKDNMLTIYLTSIIPRDQQDEFITLDVGDFVITEYGEPIYLQYEINKNV